MVKNVGKMVKKEGKMMENVGKMVKKKGKW